MSKTVNLPGHRAIYYTAKLPEHVLPETWVVMVVEVDERDGGVAQVWVLATCDSETDADRVCNALIEAGP